MWVTAGLVGLNLTEQFFRREKACHRLIGLPETVDTFLGNPDDTAFSGDALERGLWRCFITASFSHAGACVGACARALARSRLSFSQGVRMW